MTEAGAAITKLASSMINDLINTIYMTERDLMQFHYVFHVGKIL